MSNDNLCVIGRYCSRHGFIHGAEAKELRERFEALRLRLDTLEANAIQSILDDVDARDSLAWLEHAPVDAAAERRAAMCRELIAAGWQTAVVLDRVLVLYNERPWEVVGGDAQRPSMRMRADLTHREIQWSPASAKRRP